MTLQSPKGPLSRMDSGTCSCSFDFCNHLIAAIKNPLSCFLLFHHFDINRFLLTHCIILSQDLCRFRSQRFRPNARRHRVVVSTSYQNFEFSPIKMRHNCNAQYQIFPPGKDTDYAKAPTIFFAHFNEASPSSCAWSSITIIPGPRLFRTFPEKQGPGAYQAGYAAAG